MTMERYARIGDGGLVQQIVEVPDGFTIGQVVPQEIVKNMVLIPDGMVAMQNDLYLDGRFVAGPQHLSEIQVRRNFLFGQAVWKRDRHRDELDMNQSTSLTEQQYQELLQYLQDLRTIPQRFSNIGEVQWPVDPTA